MLFAGFISQIFVAVTSRPVDASVGMLRLAQLVSSVLVFLLPSLFTAWLCSERPGEFLHLRGWPKIRLLGQVALSVVLISPTISLSSDLNMQLQLPDFMAPLEARMREMEDRAAEFIGQMTDEKGLSALLANLTVMALFAAVTEEFLFRGALFALLRKVIRNPHAAIWLTAVIFSAIHLQFYGFLPRLLLGAYLGYLLHWTKNLWIPVFAHFLNNATVVVVQSNDTLRENPCLTEPLAPDDRGWFSALAAVTFLLFAGCMWRIYAKTKRNSS
jgi:membrane protease YdiL (CAAX protease family)